MLELEVEWLCTSVSFWTFGRYLLFLWLETSSSSISTLYLKLIFTSTSVQPWRMRKYWKPWTPGCHSQCHWNLIKKRKCIRSVVWWLLLLMEMFCFASICLNLFNLPPKYFEQKEVWVVCMIRAAVLGVCLNGVTGSRSRTRRGWNSTSNIVVDSSRDKSGVHLHRLPTARHAEAPDFRTGKMLWYGLNMQITWDYTRILKISHVDCHLFGRNLQWRGYGQWE